MLSLDHLVVGSANLNAAQSYIEESLGVSMQTGGTHAVFQTHNALLGLEDGIYLEAIAPNPAVPEPSRSRWFDLDNFSGPARLSNWACAVDNMDAILPMMPLGVGSPVQVCRGQLSWRMAVSDEGTTPFNNLWPALIEWPIGVHPTVNLVPRGIKLRRFTLLHPEGADLAELITKNLQDDRVAIETGPIAMQAVFDTANGERWL